MRPIKSQMVAASDRAYAALIPLARPRKPTAQPIPKGRKMCQYFRMPRPGWASVSIIGRYTSNTTASTPPETPGRIAPAPISAPHSRSRSQRARSACLYGSVIFHLLTQTVYRVSYQHSPFRAIRNYERFENFSGFERIDALKAPVSPFGKGIVIFR